VEVEGKRISLSNLTKVMYPATGYTKGQMIEYYVRVAPVLLAHLADRPLTLIRYPDGVDEGHFYEKRCPPHAPEWVQTIDVPSGSKGVVRHVNCADMATLVWLANLATLELHPLLARAPRLAHPTMLMIDLDPGAPADILTAGKVAHLARALFEPAGLTVLVKTSGSKGLHLAVPLDGSATYEQVRPLAQRVADALAAQHPDLVVAVQTKARRVGKVLVDWNQNGFVNTTACVYSLRATPQPRVSTPITWDELDDALADGDADQLAFGPAEVLERVTRLGDLWAQAT